MKITIDAESYFHSKEFTLKKLSTLEYIRDPRFKLHGFGVAVEDKPPFWVPGKDVKAWVESVNWADVELSAFNAKFDCFILWEHFKVKPRLYIDPMSMARAALGCKIKGYSLATVSEYFGLAPKGVMKTDGLVDLTPEQEKELADYCLHDVDLARQIEGLTAKLLPKDIYPAISQTIEMFVNPRITLDVPLLEKAAKEEKERKATILEKSIYDPKVFASNKQFPDLLTKLGYDVPMKPSPKQKNEDGSVKMIPAIALGDTDFLDMLNSDNEELKTLCECRVAVKSRLLETRSEKLCRIGQTGLWSFDVQFSGAKTHRYSGGNGAGGNPQNFTACRDKKAHKAGHQCKGFLRQAVTAGPYKGLVVGDFAAVEARLQAFLAKDIRLTGIFKSGGDPYCDFASEFYGGPITKADEAQRMFGKTAVLGLGYGMWADKFIKTVKLKTGQVIDIETSKNTVELYRRLYKGIPDLWAYLDQLIPYISESRKGQIGSLPIEYRKDMIILPDGLSIHYPNLRKSFNDKRKKDQWVYDSYEKGRPVVLSLYGGKLLENICQGLAGVLCRQVMLKFDNVVGQNHDEILLISNDPEQDAKDLKEQMEISPSWMPELKLESEVHWGANWLSAK